MSHSHQITELLQAWSKGDQQALDQLFPLVDGELRKIAHAYMRRERDGHTLQTTALVDEALMRLMGPEKITWRSRKHFYALVALRMQRILIEHARRQLTNKRGNRPEHINVDDAINLTFEESEEILILHEALKKLATIDERKAKVVEYRYFVGLSLEEVAAILEVSSATVEREWRLARAWLKREMRASESA